MTPMWTDDQNTLLVAMLDELIPPSSDGRVPGAGQLGVAGFFPTATQYAPDPVAAVNEVLTFVIDQGNFLDADRNGKIAILKRAEVEHPQAFETLSRLTYMGYYSRPDTRPLFGVGAHPIHPTGYDVAPESAADLATLTAPVRGRGKAYRDGT